MSEGGSKRLREQQAGTQSVEPPSQTGSFLIR